MARSPAEPKPRSAFRAGGATPAALLRTVRAIGRDEAVAWVALFGSRACGEARPDSDADVAVGLRPPLEPADVAALVRRLERSWRVPGVELDLLLADRAGPVIRHVVAAGGRLVAARDPLAWARFREAAVRDYLDELPTLRFHEEALRQRIRDGTFAR